MSITPDYQRPWPAYFDAVASQPPRDTLLRALINMQRTPTDTTAPIIAIDLACGEGRDTRAMLASPLNLHVFATDSSPDAITRLRATLPAAHVARVTPLQLSLETAATSPLLPTAAHLINASFALPFCHEDHFPTLWKWIVQTLTPGGRFAGQIFGDRDEWAAVNPRRHFTREDTLSLLAPFEFEHFEEVEKDGSDALMKTKHHHLFHIVARKR